MGDVAWQEHHIAWLKLYHQTLWKLSKTINYQGINGGLSYVKHDKVGDLIKKLIIFPFSEFQSFQINMAHFFPSLSVSLFLAPSFSFHFSSHSYTQSDTHIFLQLVFVFHLCGSSVGGCVCVNFCIHCHNYIFKFKRIFPLSSVLKPRNHTRKLLSLVSEDMRETNTSVAGVALLLSPLTLHMPSLTLAETRSSSFMEQNRISIVSERSLLLHLTSTYLTCSVQGCALHLNIKTEPAQWPKHSIHKNLPPRTANRVITKLIAGSSATQKGTCLC